MFMQSSQLAQYRAIDCQPPGPGSRLNTVQGTPVNSSSGIEPKNDLEKDVLNFLISKKHSLANSNVLVDARSNGGSDTCIDD